MSLSTCRIKFSLCWWFCVKGSEGKLTVVAQKMSVLSGNILSSTHDRLFIDIQASEVVLSVCLNQESEVAVITPCLVRPLSLWAAAWPWCSHRTCSRKVGRQSGVSRTPRWCRRLMIVPLFSSPRGDAGARGVCVISVDGPLDSGGPIGAESMV